MKHFSLLGSVFRSSALKPPNTDLEQSLKESGMLGQNPKAVNVKRRDIETASVGSRSRSVLSTTSGQRSRRPIVTPCIQKRQTQDIFDDFETGSSISSRIQTTEENIDRSENNTPNVFYRKYLNKNDPPSTSNFIQLNEFLDRLLSEGSRDDPLVQSEAFDFVFTEVIRQYFMECGGQGRLLDKLRLFYTSIAQHIPKLRKNFETELCHLNDVIKGCDDEIETLEQQLVPAEEKKKHLDSIISELKNEYQLLVDHLDGLNRSIAVTSKELTQMKLEREKLDSRIVKKDEKLVKLNEELRSLDNVSANSTKSTVQVAEQMKKLANDIEERKKKVAELKAGNHNIKVQIKRADVEIENLEAMIEESQKYVEMFEKDVQVDLVIKARRSPVLEQARKRREEAVIASSKPAPAKIFKETAEGETIVDIPPEGVSISTYDDFAALKQTILENTETFQVSRTEIKNAENGDFELKSDPSDESSFDFLRLFASKVISDVLDQAVRKVSLRECSTQTMAKAPVYKETGKRSRRNSSAGVNVSGRSARTARSCRSVAGGTSILCETGESELLSFVEMIPEDYSDREPKTLGWMTKNIRMIYDEKYQSDLAILSSKKKKSSLIGFPEFTFDLACSKHSLDFMAYQFCWDLHNTGVDLRDSSPEVDMFMNVLERKVSREQLAFMLKCRDDILKVGAVVNVKTEDQTEQITQYYLSQDQIEPALQRWWRHRYHSKLLHHIMGFAVARPAVHLEATKRYISMDNILAVMIEEFSKDTMEQMSELLRVSRIIPRMTEEKFNDFMKTMIPSLTVQDCNRFYRATVSKSSNRKDISPKQFRSAFNSMSLLFSREKPQEQDSDMKELLEYIRLEWERRKDSMTFVMRHFEGILAQHPDNLTIRALVTDAQRFEQMLCHSITIKNAQEACMNYFQLVFCLDMLFSSVHSFDVKMGESSLVSLECCVKECWLDSRFEHYSGN